MTSVEEKHPTTKKRWRRLDDHVRCGLRWYAAFAAVAVLGAAWVHLDSVVGVVANAILRNAIGFEDKELPHTALPIRNSSANIQLIGGQGAGIDCSLPPVIGLQAFPREKNEADIRLQVRQACAFHDYCYRHGDATYGYTQADCDFFLQQHAFRLCTQIYRNKKTQSECETDARKVLLGVRMGGWYKSYRRADAAEPDERSLYFEFDPYPLKSPEYTAFRIADTPGNLLGEAQRAQFAKKSLYVFRVRPSGVKMRIVGFKTGTEAGSKVIKEIDLPGDYDSIARPPLVVRHEESEKDWLVWPHRRSLDNTAISFSGLSPASATKEDWECLAKGCDAGPSYFGRIKIKNGASREDPLLADFYPPLEAGDEGLDRTALNLFGLTTHTCAGDRQKDKSLCVTHVTIRPGQKEGSYHQSLMWETKDTRRESILKTKHIDHYRNFASPSIVKSRGGTPALLWLRRGRGENGKDYEKTAYVRWALAKDGTKDGTFSEEPGYHFLKELPGLSEKFEPVALVNLQDSSPGLLGLHTGGCETVQIYLANIRPDEPDIKSDEKACVKGTLHRSFFDRPVQIVAGDKIVVLRHSIDESEGMFTVKLEIQSSKPEEIPQGNSTPGGNLEVAKFYRCAVKGGSDAKWTLTSEDRKECNGVKYGRAQTPEETVKIATRAVNRTPAIVAFIDDDKVPDIVFPHPIDRTKAVWLKGQLTDGKLTWERR